MVSEDFKPFFKASQDRKGWAKETWVIEQNGDEHCKNVRNKILENSRLGKYYVEMQGVLHKTATTDSSIKLPKHRIMVPESLKAFVLGQHHNLELHGHQGRKRTTKMVCNRYYWPGMRADISRWVMACSGCRRRKTTRPMNNGLTQLTLASEPWTVVGIDIYGPLPTTEDGYKWILTIVDQFSRWPIAVPIRSKSSSDIANAVFTHLVTHHGAPKVVLSDMGKELISQGMKQLCALWGIRKVTTGGYNPQGNAFCERFHRYLGSAMTILKPGEEGSAGWELLLPAILFSYRCSENDSTGYSPYFILNGKEPRLPDKLSFSNEEDEPVVYVEEYVSTLHKNLQKAFDLARKQQYAAAMENSERAHQKTKPNFKEGDYLYLWERSAAEGVFHDPKAKIARKLPKKWTNPWTGPYKFIKWESERRVVIDKNGLMESHHVNRLSKHTPWDTTIRDTNEWNLTAKKQDK